MEQYYTNELTLELAASLARSPGTTARIVTGRGLSR